MGWSDQAVSSEGHQQHVSSRVLRGSVAGAALAVVLGCAGMPLTGPSVPSPGPELEVEVKGWSDRLVDGALPDDAVDCERHVVALPWLVATTDDPALGRAALEGMLPCEVSVEHRQLALLAALSHPDRSFVGAALELAGEHLAEAAVGDPVVQAVAETLVGHEDLGVRYEALEALDRYTWTADPLAAQAMLEALTDDAPPVVSETLQRARFRAAGIQEVEAWVATARFAMRAHLDPGIRGRAALLLARLAPDHGGVGREVRGLLADEHPYARSAAAEAVAEMGDLAGVHALLPLVDDEAANGWLMLPWDATSGRKRRQLHVGSHLERVDDAALRALASLTEPMGDEGFTYREIHLKYLELDLISARRDAKAWYEAHLDALPPPPDVPAGTR